MNVTNASIKIISLLALVSFLMRLSIACIGVLNVIAKPVSSAGRID